MQDTPPCGGASLYHITSSYLRRFHNYSQHMKIQDGRLAAILDFAWQQTQYMTHPLMVMHHCAKLRQIIFNGSRDNGQENPRWLPGGHIGFRTAANVVHDTPSDDDVSPCKLTSKNSARFRNGSPVTKIQDGRLAAILDCARRRMWCMTHLCIVMYTPAKREQKIPHGFKMPARKRT